MSAHTASDLNGNSTDWIRDLVYLAFPEGESRERVLIDLVRQFAKMDPEDPEWLRYKLSVVECRAMENIANRLVESAAAQERLRGITREISDFTARELKATIQNATADTRQLLEDVQANLHDAIAGEAILKSYTEETREKFGLVIGKVTEAQLVRALEISQSKMDTWVKGKLDDSVKLAEGALGAVTRDFRIRLFGAWSNLLWGVFAAGLLAGGALLACGFWLGRHW